MLLLVSMDVGSPDFEEKIKFGETKLVTEKLDGTPHILSNSEGDSGDIEFGNTGFKIILGWNRFDFLPEGKLSTDENNRSKYSSMLAVSFLEIHRLLNNPAKLTELKIGGLADIEEISALTNDKLVNAIKGLFSRSNVPHLAYMNEEGYRIKVNLSNFKNLGEDDPLMVYLNKVSRERVEDIVVTYEKTVKRS